MRADTGRRARPVRRAGRASPREGRNGHVLRGYVRAAGTCRAIRRARVEFWLAGPQGEYGDRWRATLFSRANGFYRFESHFPPPYSTRAPHVHIRVSARGYRTLVTQFYPRRGVTSARFNLVLRRAR